MSFMTYYIYLIEALIKKHHQHKPKEFFEMVEYEVAFATGLRFDEPILDRILHRHELLRRIPGEVVFGGWCLGDSCKKNSFLCPVLVQR